METMKGFYNISIGCFKIFLSSLLKKSFPMRITLEAIAQEQQFTVWFFFFIPTNKKDHHMQEKSGDLYTIIIKNQNVLPQC